MHIQSVHIQYQPDITGPWVRHLPRQTDQTLKRTLSCRSRCTLSLYPIATVKMSSTGYATTILVLHPPDVAPHPFLNRALLERVGVIESLNHRSCLVFRGPRSELLETCCCCSGHGSR